MGSAAATALSRRGRRPAEDQLLRWSCAWIAEGVFTGVRLS
jgi:hypothetical protein